MNKYILLILILLLSACSPSLLIKSNIPKPVIVQLPMRTTLNMEQAFTKYTYTENDKKRNLSKVALGAAQSALFRTIFENLTQLQPSAKTAQIQITPELIELQYILPSESKTQFFEVWVKYRIKVQQSNKVVLADWQIKGYGKYPVSKVSTYHNNFNKATTIALRDAGAQIAIGFAKQSAVKKWLKNQEKKEK